MPDAPSTPCWSDALLDRLRQQGDPPCDALIDEVFARQEVGAVNDLLCHLDQDSELVPERLPPPVRAFLDASAALPAWTSQDLLAEGERVFSRYAPHIVVALHCAALPECYAAAKGAEVLCRTRRLEEYTYRRIMETGQFLLDITAPGGMGPQGHGVRSAQKVRLLHSTIRHHLRQQGAWDPALGAPINQEDLLGTLMAFVVPTADALEKLGLTWTAAEREAYLHVWKVAGALLGVAEAHLPADYAAADALTRQIRRRQWAPSQCGKDLMAALIKYLEYVTPGNIMDGFPVVVMRHCLDESLCEMLGVPQPDWTRSLMTPFQALCDAGEEVVEHSAMIARLTELLGRKTLEGLCWVLRGGQRYQIRLPQTLTESWGIVTP